VAEPEVERARARAAVHLAAVLFGVAGPLGKALALSPLALTAGRAAVAALVLLLARPFESPAADRTGRSGGAELALGLVLAAHWSLFFAAVLRSSVAVGLVGFSTFPILVVGLDAALARRRPPWGAVLRAALAALGAGIVVGWETAPGAAAGLALGVGSGALFAVLVLGNRRLAAVRPATALARRQNAVAGLVLLPFAAPELAGMSASTALGLVGLGAVLTAGAHGLFVFGLRRVPADRASLIASLEPVWGALAAAALVGEIPSPGTVVGGLLILAAGLDRPSRSRAERAYDAEP
jgi:drug/metabolite transporter (DMT)-like permease